MIHDIYTYNGRSDLLLTTTCGISSHGIHDILACYTRAISLGGCVIYGRLLYIYIQTCINICFPTQNGWETGNIICFLCLSKLDALFTSLCYYLFHERESSNEDIAFWGCIWCFETSMMIRCNILYDLRWRWLRERVYDRIDRIGAWGHVDMYQLNMLIM